MRIACMSCISARFHVSLQRINHLVPKCKQTEKAEKATRYVNGPWTKEQALTPQLSRYQSKTSSALRLYKDFLGRVSEYIVIFDPSP